MKSFPIHIFVIIDVLYFAKYSCKIFRNLRLDYVICCFIIKLWSFANKKMSKKKDNSHIFNMATNMYLIFWLRNTHLKILEFFL